MIKQTNVQLSSAGRVNQPIYITSLALLMMTAESMSKRTVLGNSYGFSFPLSYFRPICIVSESLYYIEKIAVSGVLNM